MKVLTVFANPSPKSFCHAILRQFTKGLEDAGHTSEVVDLYAIRFNPVFRTQDFASYVHESMPREILDEMNLARVEHYFADFMSATLTASAVLNNMSITYYLSSNNGATWTQVTSGNGVWFTGADKGQDLIFRAYLYTYDSFVSPYIDWIQLDYVKFPAPTYTITPTHTDSPTLTMTPIRIRSVAMAQAVRTV